ncbi:hypothetical protein AAEO56_00880 [Flavobacterium sp. DGU11]|uniref:Uncharacterized protein n=1 Tax=Flavobacterium arundinis TaxID=3139143 RepID=A0ABU9HSV1_9FLAO
MKTQIQQSKAEGTIQPKAEKQAPVNSILSGYGNTIQRLAVNNRGTTFGTTTGILQLYKNRRKWSGSQREQSRKFWVKKEKKEARKRQSAYYRDHIVKPDDRRTNELTILLKGDFNLAAIVKKIRLQGSTVPSNHQDIICLLDNGQNLRFSRNNFSDTAQYGADPGRLTIIYTYIPSEGTTVKAALEAFRKAHDSMRTYEHGDCQSFANAIVKGLTGQDTGFGGVDDFM